MLTEIGTLVSWSLAGSHRQHDVQAAAAAAGLGDELGLPRILANNCYRRAVRTAAAMTGASDDRRVVVKVVEETPSRVVHQFLLGSVSETNESSLTTQGARFAHLCASRFDKLAYEAGEAPERLVQVEDVADGFGRAVGETVLRVYSETAVDVHYTHADIRTASCRALRAWAGISMLDHGGLWFVPVSASDRVAAWQRFIAILPGCRSVVLPQYDVPAVRAELERRSSDALEGQLQDILTSLERFAAAGSVRLSTLEARVEAFDELRGRAELYERLLGNTMADLKDRLGDAQEALLSALNSIKE